MNTCINRAAIISQVIAVVLVLSNSLWAQDGEDQLTAGYTEADRSLYQLSNNEAAIEAGRAIYESICFVCHGKDLSGETGFNLRDGEWIHGSWPTEIKATISNGFPLQGMAAFGEILSEKQLDQITAFIISKQQGLRNLSYKLYNQFLFEDPGSKETDKIDYRNFPMPSFGEYQPTIENKLPNNFIDVFISDEPVYGIEFNGLLLVPEDGQYSFSYDSKSMPSELFIDGERIISSTKRVKGAVPLILKKGIHDFRSTFFLMERDKPRLSFRWSGPGFKDDPLAMEDRKAMMVKHDVLVSNQPKIYRVSMEGFPSGSVYIGFPEKLNVVFGVDSGSILGYWQGDFLDIGGAITKRSQLPALPLGNWVFQESEEAGVCLYLDNMKTQANFRGYSVDPQPTLRYEIGEENKVPVELRIEARSPGQINLRYSLDGLRTKRVSLSLPPGIRAESSGGQISDGFLHVDPDKSNDFSITLFQ